MTAVRTTSLGGDADNQAATYAAQGYLFPVEVFDAERAAAYLARLEAAETTSHGHRLGNKQQLNYPHVIYGFADEIIRSPRILDVVEALIGPDIMVWGSTFFIKEPRSASYVSWHQDLRYWGLDSDALVSAWVALSPVTRANGCMRFVPASHRNELLPHRDTFADDNALTRGQEVDIAIDEQRVLHVELKAGQASFHHGRLLHASAPNPSDQRRVGYTINYLAPHMRQVVARTDFATLVRGEDRFGHFQQVPSPVGDLSAEALAWHRRILEVQNEAMYQGLDRPPV